MKRQHLTILGLVLVLLGGVYLATERPFAVRRGAGGLMPVNLLFADFSADDAERITVSGPSDWVALVREPLGWMIEGEPRRHADDSKVSEALQKISELTTSDLVSMIPDKHEVFEVNAEKGTRVTAAAGSDLVLADLVIGKPGPDFMSSYVRKADGSDVYLSGHGLSFALRPDEAFWRDRKLMSFSTEDVTRLSVECREAAFVVTRDGDGGWRLTAPDELAADTSEVEKLLGHLANLNASGFADDRSPSECGLALVAGGEPEATVTVELSSGPAQTVYIGLRDEDVYCVRRADRETIYELREWSVERILKSPEDLASSANASESASPSTTK